jgi:NAD(P)-dependent dehydrogenase (short-subunit alcohol dehydrogenase family)
MWSLSPMEQIIITGASRGIRAALARELGGPGMRLVLLARDAERLDDLRAEIVARGGDAVVVVGDLSSVAGAHSAAERIGEHVSAGVTLVQNAGVWPSKRRLTPEGLEIAFVVNHLAPQVLAEKLLAAGPLSRMLVVSAGLIIKGRFDPERSPTGDDFSAFRTYCTTKLCSAVAARSLAARHPALDVCVLHPGIVRTDLGARSGPLGAVISLVKRRWGDPSVTATRLARSSPRSAVPSQVTPSGGSSRTLRHGPMRRMTRRFGRLSSGQAVCCWRHMPSSRPRLHDLLAPAFAAHRAEYAGVSS